MRWESTFSRYLNTKGKASQKALKMLQAHQDLVGQSILLKLLPQNDGPVDHWSRTKFLITHVIKQLWPHPELDLKFSVYV